MSHRVPAPGADLDAPTIPLPDDAAHHLVHVLRLGVGAPVIVFDAGREVTATLQHADGAWCAQASGPARAGVGGAAVTLAYGLPKGDKLDAVLRQVTELGVQRVVLLDCARSVVRLSAERASKRLDRLARVVEQAARQCGRADVPDIEGPRAVAAAAEVLADHTRWVLHPEGGGPIAAAPLGAPLAVFVGPEGGFAPDELAALEGAHRVTLGPRVLRTETAAPVACALALHRLGGAVKGAPVMLAVDAAPFWRRLLAGLIDLGLLAALGYALWTVGVIAPHHLPPQRFDWIDYTADLLANHRVQFRPAAVVLLTAAAVHGLVGRTFAGRTVGEALLGLRLVTWYGEDAGPVRSLAHTAGTVVGLALLLLGYVWAAVDPRRQGLAEYVSGTLLVRGKPRADR